MSEKTYTLTENELIRLHGLAVTGVGLEPWMNSIPTTQAPAVPSDYSGKLWRDCKDDDERFDFILSGRAHETGIMALAIQNEVAMAFKFRSETMKERNAVPSDFSRGEFVDLIKNELGVDQMGRVVAVPGDIVDFIFTHGYRERLK